MSGVGTNAAPFAPLPFDDVLGFVLTTDASGTITDVKFALKIPAKPAA